MEEKFTDVKIHVKSVMLNKDLTQEEAWKGPVCRELSDLVNGGYIQ
jgi:hypothetical protein